MREFPRQVRRGEAEPGAGTPVRVLAIHTPTVAPLGADTWIQAQIIANLDRATHEIHVACATGAPDAPTPTYEAFRRLDHIDIRPVRFGLERKNASWAGRWQHAASVPPAILDFVGLARYIRRHRIDILHTTDRPRDAAAVVALGRLTGATSVVQTHVAYGDWMSPVLKWALRQADVRIAISTYVAATLAASGLDVCRTYVVRNGIDPTQWTPRLGRDDARRELGVPDGVPVILTACRLFSSKGPGELIRAVAAMESRQPDARLFIVGREMVPGYAAELAALARELGVGDRVTLLGHRPDMGRLMAAADVFAMPSVGEPFGLVYAEAMAMELPVVALDHGGAPEVVQHGATGLLSAPGDLETLTDNLCRVLADPDRCRRMGVNGRRRVETLFTSGRMADDVANVYRAVLGRQNPVAERLVLPFADPAPERDTDATTVR